ncbi:acetyl-CoA acetyltransferase 2 [Lycorma delicatula]|uniref:acetyl-CoA acetyltransferase 2 n=1 Tax=Lycorma delicatula TaxID=130591 RepID=UPI003F515AD7
MKESDVCIVAAARTPIGSFCGSLSSLKSHEMGCIVIREVLEKLKIQPDEVSEVIIGQTLIAGQGQNPARQAAVNAGIPYSVPAYLISMLCGSGLRSVIAGCQSIKCGDAKIVISGGQESMSQAPHIAHVRSGIKMGNTEFVDTMISDGLTDAFHNIHMGITAENIATKYGITREEQDKYALESQIKTKIAQKEGYFKREIVPVKLSKRKNIVMVSEDEFPKHDTTMESLRRLEPVFVKGGSVTAGNASGLNDGAAVVVLMNSLIAREKSLQPLGRIVAYSQSGLEPEIMGMGPVPAVNSLLEKAGWSKDEVDLYELNEPFAAQAIAVAKELGIDASKININGGAISIGHPLGCSGTRILVTLLYALERTGGKKGVAALCIGGGMGIAIAVQRD